MSPLSRYLFKQEIYEYSCLKNDSVTAVILVFKCDDRSAVKNYRPINITSLVVKTMERNS